MKRILIIVGIVLALPILFVGGLAAYLVASEYTPEPVEPVEVARFDAQTPQGLVAGQPFTAVSWNIQFGLGITDEPFFYEHGTRVHGTAEEVEQTMRAVAKAIRGYDADIALIQELDRGSARSQSIDELPLVRDAGGYAFTATAPYHRAYVPSPPLNPLGRVDMHLALLSRSPMQAAQRTQLALLQENRVVQAANLKRALLTAEVPVEGHPQPLAIGVTHLSAFSQGDGTLDKQVAQLVAWIEARAPDQPWILAGDFNMLPPGDDPQRLDPEQAAYYADATNPIEQMIPKYRTVWTELLADGSRTFVPHGSKTPDRKIDYVFIGGPIEVVERRVDTTLIGVSDHLPMIATLRVGAAPAPAPTPPAAPADAAAGEAPAQPADQAGEPPSEGDAPPAEGGDGP